MATLLFKFVFVSNASPAVVLTDTELTGADAPTINISTTAIVDGAVTSLVSAGALTYDSYTKSWSYRLANADLASYLYTGMATTTLATASPASVHALGLVLPDELIGPRTLPSADYVVVGDLPAAAPSAAAIDGQLSGSHGAGAWGAGVGAFSKVYTVTVGGAPRAGAYCRLTTRAAPTVNLSAGTSNGLGQVTFWHNLPTGTLVYVHVALDGHEPLTDEEVI